MTTKNEDTALAALVDRVKRDLQGAAASGQTATVKEIVDKLEKDHGIKTNTHAVKRILKALPQDVSKTTPSRTATGERVSSSSSSTTNKTDTKKMEFRPNLRARRQQESDGVDGLLQIGTIVQLQGFVGPARDRNGLLGVITSRPGERGRVEESIDWDAPQMSHWKTQYMVYVPNNVPCPRTGRPGFAFNMLPVARRDLRVVDLSFNDISANPSDEFFEVWPTAFETNALHRKILEKANLLKVNPTSCTYKKSNSAEAGVVGVETGASAGMPLSSEHPTEHATDSKVITASTSSCFTSSSEQKKVGDVVDDKSILDPLQDRKFENPLLLTGLTTRIVAKVENPGKDRNIDGALIKVPAPPQPLECSQLPVTPLYGLPENIAELVRKLNAPKLSVRDGFVAGKKEFDIKHFLKNPQFYDKTSTRRPWSNPVNVGAYSKKSLEKKSHAKDLRIWFDLDDVNSPPNEYATHAFNGYLHIDCPELLFGPQNGRFRGCVVVERCAPIHRVDMSQEERVTDEDAGIMAEELEEFYGDGVEAVCSSKVVEEGEKSSSASKRGPQTKIEEMNWNLADDTGPYVLDEVTGRVRPRDEDPNSGGIQDMPEETMMILEGAKIEKHTYEPEIVDECLDDKQYKDGEKERVEYKYETRKTLRYGKKLLEEGAARKLGIQQIQETLWHYWCEYHGLEQDGYTRKTRSWMEEVKGSDLPPGQHSFSNYIKNAKTKMNMKDINNCTRKMMNKQIQEHRNKVKGAPSIEEDENKDLLRDPANFETEKLVRIHSLESATEQNGKIAMLGLYDETKGRWSVFLTDEQERELSLKPKNLELLSKNEVRARQFLQPGRKVRAHGLEGAKHLNGKVGTLGAFDRQKSRWAVTFDDVDDDKTTEKQEEQDGHGGGTRGATTRAQGKKKAPPLAIRFGNLAMLEEDILRLEEEEKMVDAIFGRDPEKKPYLHFDISDWGKKLLDMSRFGGQPMISLSRFSLMRRHSTQDVGQLLKEKVQSVVENCAPTTGRRGRPDPTALANGYLRFWCREFGSCGVQSSHTRTRWMGVQPSTPYLHGRDALDIYMEQDRIRQYTTSDGPVPAHTRISEADAKAMPHFII
ncbi:unnamed protein product [Amoebophrya sp. A25]|nr:unnamed protein product [Amoebophrya sp. A25]|eukprot:GSA25T00008964001.1